MDQKQNIFPSLFNCSLTKKKKKHDVLQTVNTITQSNCQINVGDVCFCKTMDMSKLYISFGATALLIVRLGEVTMT